MKMHPTNARQSYHRDTTMGGHYLRIRNRREAERERWREREERFGVPPAMDAGEKERIRRHKLAYELQRTRAGRLDYKGTRSVDHVGQSVARPTIEVRHDNGSVYVRVYGQPEDVESMLGALEDAVREAKEEARKRLEAFDGA